MITIPLQDNHYNITLSRHCIHLSTLVIMSATSITPPPRTIQDVQLAPMRPLRHLPATHTMHPVVVRRLAFDGFENDNPEQQPFAPQHNNVFEDNPNQI